MNKKIFQFLLVYFYIYLCPLYAEIEGTLELRTAAFIPTSELFRDIYDDVGASYQIETSTSFTNYLDGWANFDWFSKHGNSKGFNDPTRLSIANLSLGLKLPYQITDSLTAYIGIGPSLSRIWLKNKSPCTNQNFTKLALGGIIKSGINYFVTEHVFLDIFVDYLYQPVHFKKHIDVGGLKTGAGLGYRF